MHRSTCAAALLLCLAATVPAQNAGLVLPFRETQRSWRLRPDTDEVLTPKPTETTRRGELWLSAGRCELRTEQTRTIWDFERDVLIQVDVQQKTCTETALLARIASRQLEFQYQQRVVLMLGRVSKGEKPSADPFFVAARFGLDPGHTEAPQRSAQDGQVAILYRGQRVTSWRLSDAEWPGEAASWFERALWWSQSLHPAARRLLIAEGRIPAQLSYTGYALGTRTDVEIQFEAARAVDSVGADFHGLARTGRPDDPLDRAAALALGAGGKTAPGRDALLDLARRASESNRLDAFLLASEWSLQSGEADVVQSTLGAKIADDPAVQRLLEAQSKTATEPDLAITALRAFDRGKLTHPYVLDTFLGAAVATTGRQDEAQGLLLAALTQNPWLALTWKQLGDLYHRYQDMDRAWQCWNVARTLQPNLKELASVLEIEAKLSAEFRAFL